MLRSQQIPDHFYFLVQEHYIYLRANAAAQQCSRKHKCVSWC